MKNRNAMDEPHEGAQSITNNKFSLVEQVLNKKHMDKARADIRQLKEIVGEMQINVTSQGTKINTELVDEMKLQITMELLEQQFDDRCRHGLQLLEDKFKPKIKKRVRDKDI